MCIIGCQGNLHKKMRKVFLVDVVFLVMCVLQLKEQCQYFVLFLDSGLCK